MREIPKAEMWPDHDGHDIVELVRIEHVYEFNTINYDDDFGVVDVYYTNERMGELLDSYFYCSTCSKRLPDVVSEGQ